MTEPVSTLPNVEVKGIEQTRQLMRAALRVGVRIKKATSDGKISIAEYAGFTADVGIIIEAIRGIAKVPGELLDLAPAEASELSSECVAFLAELGVTTRQEEAISKAFDFIQKGIEFLSHLVIAPPTAQAVS